MNYNIFISRILSQFHFWCCTKSAVNTQQKKVGTFAPTFLL